MAEQEVIKHTKKLITTVKEPGTGWKHKLKEIILEILIIVFAVTLSISLHNWSEGRHDRHEEVVFLQGLRTDLGKDIIEMKDDQRSHRRWSSATAYFARVVAGEPLSTDSLGEYVSIFESSTLMNPNISRFEGLKASGKLGIIRNEALLNNILDFYQEDIPFLNLLNTQINNVKFQRLAPLVDKQLLYQEGHVSNWADVLKSNELQNVMRRVGDANEVIAIYDTAIARAQTIVGQINEQLK